MPSELPDNLKSLAAGLDALAGRASASPEADSLPTLDGTDFEPFAELGRGGMGVRLVRLTEGAQLVSVSVVAAEPEEAAASPEGQEGDLQ